MKKLITIVLLLAATRAFSQDSLTVYNVYRDQINSNGSKILAGWAVANIASGIVGAAATQSGTSTHYFFQMNAIWNVVNLGAAAYAYTTAWNAQSRLSQQNSVIAQHKAENILLINGGLDLVYIGAGAFLYHQGTSKNSAIRKGYGTSVALQGLFLLIFDTTMYSMQKHNGKKLMHFVNKNPIAFDGRNLSISISI